MKNKTLTMVVLSGAVLMTGCTALTVSDGKMKQRASQSLGVSEENITVESRSEGVLRSDFKVKANNQTYGCYVNSLFGLSTTDAICTEFDNSGQNTTKVEKPQSSENSNCNALTRAAGKC